MEKLDLKKKYKELYKGGDNISIVHVPEFSYIMIDGSGNPNTSDEFKEFIETLYSISYTIKFMVKKGVNPVDYSVMPLEGLWWTDDMKDFSMGNKDIWKWTLMITQPDFITEEIFREGLKKVKEKKSFSSLEKVRFERYNEGLSVQILHRGPYSEEGPTMEKLHAYIKEKGYEFKGKHHEIYSGDPKRTDPKNLKTILRQPVKKKKLRK